MRSNDMQSPRIIVVDSSDWQASCQLYKRQCGRRVALAELCSLRAWLEIELDALGVDGRVFARCLVRLVQSCVEDLHNGEDLWQCAEAPILELLSAVDADQRNLADLLASLSARIRSLSGATLPAYFDAACDDSADSGVCSTPDADDRLQNYDEAFPPLQDLHQERHICETQPTSSASPISHAPLFRPQISVTAPINDASVGIVQGTESVPSKQWAGWDKKGLLAGCPFDNGKDAHADASSCNQPRNYSSSAPRFLLPYIRSDSGVDGTFARSASNVLLPATSVGTAPSRCEVVNVNPEMSGGRQRYREHLSPRKARRVQVAVGRARHVSPIELRYLRYSGPSFCLPRVPQTNKSDPLPVQRDNFSAPLSHRDNATNFGQDFVFRDDVILVNSPVKKSVDSAPPVERTCALREPTHSVIFPSVTTITSDVDQSIFPPCQSAPTISTFWPVIWSDATRDSNQNEPTVADNQNSRSVHLNEAQLAMESAEDDQLLELVGSLSVRAPLSNDS